MWVPGGLQQRAGGAARQGGAVVVSWAGPNRQQVIMARDVAVPGQIIWVLAVTGNSHVFHAGLHDADGWFWKAGEDSVREQQHCRTRLYLIHDNCATGRIVGLASI